MVFYWIFILYSWLQDVAKEVSTNKYTYPGTFYALQCDVTNEIDIETTFKEIQTNIGPIWILVNSAGEITGSLLMGKDHV